METGKEMAKQTATPPAKELFSQPLIKQKFQELLGKRAPAFMTSVLQVVATNGDLQLADPQSIYHAAAVAATLDLPINNNLGFAYIIPYEQRYQDANNQWQSKKVAQFQLGYKGFKQLGLRSGQFLALEEKPVYEGQYIEDNSFLGYHFDWKAKKSETVIGYAAYFKLLNGFEKFLYMTIDELRQHGLKYSKTFSSKKQETREKSKWATDFDAMAKKTVIKLLISRHAPLSVEMTKAIETDQAVINNPDGTDVTFVDQAQDDPVDQLWLDLLKECKTLEDVDAKFKENEEQINADPRLKHLFQERKDQIKKPSAAELARRATQKTEDLLNK